MTARCHNDSCSVEWSEVTTLNGLAYQADVILDPLRSLSCIEGQGVGVVISPDAGNLLSNVGNGLYAGAPDHDIDAFFDANLASIPQSADSASTVSGGTHSYTNATGRPATVIVQAELSVGYAILGDGNGYSYGAGNGNRSGIIPAAGAGVDPVGFNAHFGARLKGNINAAATTVVAGTRMPIGGVMFVFDANDFQYQIARSTVAYAFTVLAGQTLNVQGDAFYQGPDQTINVVTAQSIPNIDAAVVGFGITSGQFITLPY